MSNVKEKDDTKQKAIILSICGAVWFLLISYIVALTEYPEKIVDVLRDTYNYHQYWKIESPIGVAMTLLSLLPSGILLTLAYTSLRQYKSKVAKIFLAAALTLIVTAALSILFWQYNFYVNFAI